LFFIVGISLVIGFYVSKFRKYSIGIVSAFGGVMMGFVLTTAFII